MITLRTTYILYSYTNPVGTGQSNDSATHGYVAWQRLAKGKMDFRFSMLMLCRDPLLISFGRSLVSFGLLFQAY